MEGSFDLGFGILDDLMDEICFISAADLWQCRELGSSWRRRIRNNDSRNRHLTASKNNNMCLIFYFMCERPRMPIPYYGVYITGDREFQFLRTLKAHPSLENVIFLRLFVSVMI